MSQLSHPSGGSLLGQMTIAMASNAEGSSLFYALGTLLVVCVVTLAGCAAGRSQAPARSPGQSTATTDDGSIPTDPSVLRGTLENGFTYYVRRDGLPSGGIYLGLVVKAGWANESEGQQGLAHLVEHVVFGGTPRFERDKLAGFLRRLGLEPAPDRNVVTSVDLTVYGLALPANAGDALPTALDLLGEWSSGLAFESAQVERERRAVLEEIRQVGDPGQQLARQTLEILLRGNDSAARPSSSAKGVLEKASPEQLLGFYRTWYRPERMAVIAVGELEPKQLEQAIRDRFGRIKGPGPASVPAPAPAVPFVQLGHDTSFANLAAPEPEDSDDDEDDEPEDKPPPIPTVISIGFKRPRSPVRTRADLRQSVIEAAYGSLVQARLDRLSQRPRSPLTAAKWFSVPHLPVHLCVVQAAVKPGRLEAGVQALWAELRGIGLGGFEARELAVAVQALKVSPVASTGREQAGDGMTDAQRMTASFLYGDALLSVEAKRDLEQKLLGQIALPEINDFARSMSTSAAKVVLASGPKDQLRPERALRAAVARAESADPGSEPAGAAGDAPVDVSPAPGSVVRAETIDEIGAAVWKLSNGATVVIKPTGFKQGEVLFQARAAGGTSLASDRDYWSASLAPKIVTAGGLGRYEPEELGKLLAGRSVEGHPWMSETEHGIRAKASPEDLELMMQLVYLGFTAPRGDPESFEEVRDQWREDLRARDADPNQAFAEIRRQQSFGNHLRRRPATPKSAGQLRLAAALDFYRQRFAQAADFTFVLVGDIDKDRLKPLVERYLASLPSPGRKGREGHDARAQWRDVGARLANGVKRIAVERGSGDTSTVTLTFHREAPWSREAETALDALRAYLEIRAREALAGQPLAARSVSVTAAFERRPIAQASLTIAFDSNHALVDGSKRAVLRLVQEVKESPARPSDVDVVRDARKQYLERQWGQNAFWLAALTEHYRFGSDPRDIQKMRTDADQIDAAMIERAARDDLDLHRYIEAVRSPRRQ